MWLLHHACGEGAPRARSRCDELDPQGVTFTASTGLGKSLTGMNPAMLSRMSLAQGHDRDITTSAERSRSPPSSRLILDMRQIVDR